MVVLTTRPRAVPSDLTSQGDLQAALGKRYHYRGGGRIRGGTGDKYALHWMGFLNTSTNITGHRFRECSAII